MIDNNGYRSNVGIILLNNTMHAFWGRRKGEDAWQFPQGGLDTEESLEECMYRELYEELGLSSSSVRVIARTSDWLYYDVPSTWLKQHTNYRGQKQIWFLLKLLSQDSKINLKAHDEPEFDAWRWIDYWEPINLVVNFKQAVYNKALHELARYI